MNFLYVDANYLIHSSDATGVAEPEAEFSAKNSIYVETSDAFALKEVNATGGGSLTILKSDIINWSTAEIGGLPFTVGTLRTFLRTETAQY